MKSSKMERKEVCYLKNMVNLKFNDDISRWELPDIYMYKINFALLTKIIKEKKSLFLSMSFNLLDLRKYFSNLTYWLRHF